MEMSGLNKLKVIRKGMFMSCIIMTLGRSLMMGLALLFVVVSQSLWAQPIKLPSADVEEVPAHIAEKVYQRLKEARSDLSLTNLRPSPLLGLYKIDINGQLAFVSEDGGFLIAGEMYKVNPGHLVKLQEEDSLIQEATFALTRAARLEQVNMDDMVVYKPEKETKGFVYIFTDIDCGFCRKLHGQMTEMLDRGIEVRYLAFPRAGIQSRSAKKLATTWCDKDPQKTMTRFKQGENVAITDCGDHPIADQYMLGQELGVRGTPAIVLESGQLIPGAVPTERIAKEMGI